MRQDTGISDQMLADQMKLSKRTVQRELKDLEYYLQDSGISLVRRYGSGVMLQGEDEDLIRLKESVIRNSKIDYTDKNERRKYLLFELLRSREPHKLYYFAEHMQVSEATISHDLDRIEDWLSENHLKILRKPGYGVMIDGCEKDCREAMQRFISENISEEKLKSIAYEQNDALARAIRESTDVGGAYGLLGGDVIQKVASILHDMNEPRLHQLAENAYIGLIVHIAIAVERILQGDIIEEESAKALIDSSTDDALLAMRIIRRLEKEFNVRIPDVELDFILLHIRCAKLMFTQDRETSENYLISEEEVLDLIDQMIDAYDPAIAQNLKWDESFIHGLLVHLQPTLIRLKNGMNITNPLLEAIQAEYPEVFEKCRASARVIEEYTGMQVNDHEIGYLATHFGAAESQIRDVQTFTRKVRIGIVCASGFGVSRLMMTRLANRLHSSNVSLQDLSYSDMHSALIRGIDFFVTSMDLKQFGVDYILVSPLITARDLSQVQCKIEEYAHIPRSDEENSFVEQLSSITAVSETIRGVLRRYRLHQVPSTVNYAELMDLVSAQCAASCDSVTQLRNDLQAREDIVTQILPEIGLILLHCRTSAVKEPLVRTVLPLEGSVFTDPSMRAVSKVMVLLVPKNSADTRFHVEMMGKISAAVVEDDTMLDIMGIPDEESMRMKLAGILRGFFSEYLADMERGGITG